MVGGGVGATGGAEVGDEAGKDRSGLATGSFLVWVFGVGFGGSGVRSVGLLERMLAMMGRGSEVFR